MSTRLIVQHREQLVYLLTEAAEIEHNLMCCYLYAAFSLKRGPDEGLSAAELSLVEGWRRSLIAVAVEEMTHLGLVTNLLVSVGGAPNFGRPNLPVDPGYYPAGVVIALAPFDLGTAEHFTFLERPDGSDLRDGDGFAPRANYARVWSEGRLMPSAQDYPTVGDLYRGIRAALDELAAASGESNLFLGDPQAQVGPERLSLPGLTAVTDLASAHAAIDTIVNQGEGAEAHRDGSHFQRFTTIVDEYRAALAARPDFAPARPVARNPVMRRPARPEGRVHIAAATAARLVDLANATYGFMLRLLAQGFGSVDPVASRLLLDAAVDAMFAISPVAEALTLQPASDEHPGVAAGMSFAMSRTLSRLRDAPSTWKLLAERAGQLARGFAESGDPTLTPHAERFTSLRERLGTLLTPTSTLPTEDRPMTTSPNGAEKNAAPAGADAPQPTAAPVPTVQDGVERIPGEALTLVYEGKRCIHSRHCVLSLPDVFRANVQGPWIAPDAAELEELVAVAHDCPSGAIRYERKDGKSEKAPAVNVVRIRENGPLAFVASLEVGGAPQIRATLCRCGASKNKPYCDGSHNGAAFQASGEPATQPSAPLAVRNGRLVVKPLPDGPLQVTGNLEICAGTGRTVAKVTATKLCRCGGSANKPYCDGTHRRNGFQAAGE